MIALKTLQKYRDLRDLDKNKIGKAETEVRILEGKVLNLHEDYLRAVEAENNTDIKKLYEEERKANEGLLLAESKLRAIKEIVGKKTKSTPECQAAAGAVHIEADEILTGFRNRQLEIKEELQGIVSGYKRLIEEFQGIATEAYDFEKQLKSEGLKRNKPLNLVFDGDLPNFNYL